MLLPGPDTDDSTGGRYDVDAADAPLLCPLTTTVQCCCTPTPGTGVQFNHECRIVSRVQFTAVRVIMSSAAYKGKHIES